MTFREFLNACKSVTRSDAEFVWIPQDYLHEHQLETDYALELTRGELSLYGAQREHTRGFTNQQRKSLSRRMANAELLKRLLWIA